MRSSVHGAGGESQPTTGAAVSGREALRVHSRAVPEDPWIREAVRLHRRYQIEIVEAYGLCPWADRATQDGRVREVVILQQDAGTLEPSLAAIDSWTLDPAVDVAFAIYPRLALGRQAFHDFAARVRDADTLRHELGSVPFVFAAFHPDADADTGFRLSTRLTAAEAFAGRVFAVSLTRPGSPR